MYAGGAITHLAQMTYTIRFPFVTSGLDSILFNPSGIDNVLVLHGHQYLFAIVYFLPFRYDSLLLLEHRRGRLLHTYTLPTHIEPQSSIPSN